MYIIEVGEVEISRFEMVLGVLDKGGFFGEQGD
jgi:CRP-like cAMP-binding protein